MDEEKLKLDEVVKLGRKYKNCIIMFLGFSFLIIAIFSYILPVWERTASLKQETTLYRNKIEAWEGFASRNRDFSSVIALKRKEYLRLTADFVSNENDECVNQLQKLASDTDISFSIIKLKQPSKDNNKWGTISFDMKVRGEYFNILKFIEKIEQYKNISIENLKIEGNAKGNITVLGKLQLFFYKKL